MALFTNTFAELKALAKHAIGKEPSTGLALADMVNDALQELGNRHQWTWRGKPLSLSISALTNSSLVRASNIVTATTSGAHGLVAGDAVRIINSTATTDTFNGQYIVSTVPTSTTFTYIQSDYANETATAGGSTVPGFVTLPEDFESLSHADLRDDLFYLEETTLSEIARWRAGIVGMDVVGLSGHWFAIGWANQVSATVGGRYRMELYPAPDTTQTNRIFGTYFRSLPKLATDAALPDIPPQAHPTLRQLVRAVAQELENLETAGAERARAEQMIAKLIEQDGLTQPSLGRMTGAAGRGRFIPSGDPVISLT